jgi:hypothetical protein
MSAGAVQVGLKTHLELGKCRGDDPIHRGLEWGAALVPLPAAMAPRRGLW